MWTSAAILLVLVASLHGHPKGKPNRLSVEDPAQVTCRALKNLSESTDAIIDNLPCEDAEDQGKCATKAIKVFKKCQSGLEMDASCIDNIFKTERSEDERKCLCGGLNLFSDTLHTNWLMICSGKRESRRFLTTKEYDPKISGQFSKLPMSDPRVTKECGGKVKTAVSSLKDFSYDLNAFHLKNFNFVTSKFVTLEDLDNGDHSYSDGLLIRYNFNEAYDSNVIGFRVWDAKNWIAKVPVTHAYYDVNAVSPSNQYLHQTKVDVGCTGDNCQMEIGARVSMDLMIIGVGTVIEFIVEYAAPVQHDVPTFQSLKMFLGSDREDDSHWNTICSKFHQYPYSDID